MLTSCKLTGDPKATANYHMGEENYYFSQAGGAEDLASDGALSTQDHVRIHGALAASLGFSDGQAITREQFSNLLSGKDASGRKVAGWRRVHGIDLTFSAPKSVSIAALLTHRDPNILAAHEAAVLETMREIERESAAAQPKPGLCAPTGNLAYVTALDGFNREHEPHIHTHVVVSNMTFYNGKVYALDGREIMTRGFNKMWGAMYRAKLAARLKELGYGVTYTKKGEFRLDAVSLEVEKAFSGRRAQILEAKERGLRDMAAWDTTRKGKDPEVAKEDVLAAWQKKLEQFQAKTPEVNRTEALAARQLWYKEAHWSVEARQELAGERETGEIGRWQLAAERATQASACVTEIEVITEYLAELGRTESWKAVTYSQAQRALQAQVQAGHILKTDNGYYTTWEMARADRECIQGHQARYVALFEARARRGIEAYQEAARRAGRKLLSERQATVAIGILSADEGSVIVQGDAGSGKTTMLRGVKEVALDAGLQIVGIAVQGVAARNLENESGIASQTLASYLEDSTHRAAGGSPRLVVLDEASMLGSRDAAKLLKIAARYGDKLVLVGDRNQIQSIGAGKPFERLVEAAEASGKLLCLNENWRQRDPVLRQAVDLARQGQMRQSLDLLQDHRCVLEVQDAVERRELVAKLYTKDTLIMTGTQASCDDLNKRIREHLIKTGSLDAKSQRECAVSWQDGDGIRHEAYLKVAVGERIRFMENDYREGLDVRNGECGIVEGVSVATLTIRHDDGRRLTLDLKKGYRSIDYGYAVTTYKGQGQTFDRVIVEADTRLPYLQDQRNSYVQITRARNEVMILTDDDQALRDTAGILSGKRDTLDLNADIKEAVRMEAKLEELARQESTVLREARSYGRKAAEAIERTAGAFPDPAPWSSPVRIENKELFAAAEGSRRLEEAVRKKIKGIEDCINGRQDVVPMDKKALAEFFSAPAAVDLILRAHKPEVAVLGAEVALGVRSKQGAYSGLSQRETREVESCIRVASAAERERHAPKPTRDLRRDFGMDFEL